MLPLFMDLNNRSKVNLCLINKFNLNDEWLKLVGIRSKSLNESYNDNTKNVGSFDEFVKYNEHT